MPENPTLPWRLLNAVPYVELLTVESEHGRATEGPKFPEDRGAAIVWLDDYGEQRTAYRHTFFRRDRDGRAIPETAVDFYVRDYMLDRGFPNLTAIRAAEERMGWTTDAR
jgi:hypothetical protein